MKLIAFFALASGFCLAAEPAKNDANQADLKKLQGDWAMVSMTRDGTAFPEGDAQALFRTVKGDRYTVFRYEKPVSEGMFVIDATKKPKTIDFLIGAKPDKSKPMHGIYEFDGAKLRFCYAPVGKERPAAFTSTEGSGLTITVWEPEKK